MALDVGIKTIGVAITDPLRITARPLQTIYRGEWEADIEALADLIRLHRVELLVVGLPRHLDGRPGALLQSIRTLAETLADRTSVPFDWCDERLSTREAEELMSLNRIPVRERRSKRNEYAAALILRRYLQEHGSQTE